MAQHFVSVIAAGGLFHPYDLEAAGRRPGPDCAGDPQWSVLTGTP
ncbi:hypothetical protein [Streptomyces sp. NPDC057939]